MSKLKKIITTLHTSTKRNFISRMNDEKIKCMKKANKFGYEYWDGNRRFGYGGYKYMPGRWSLAAKKIIKTYNLKSNSKILDVGCGKGFLLKEIKNILPNIYIRGFDISKYALKKAHTDIKKTLFYHDARKKFPFKKKYFDLVISINTLHNLNIGDLSLALKECERVSRKKYIAVESYRNEEELFNLQCWALTCKSFLSTVEWKWIFRNSNYKGYFEFIYFN
jgi:ubiquinone/menaquinone biosynthesis C-methylase UbiE